MRHPPENSASGRARSPSRNPRPLRTTRRLRLEPVAAERLEAVLEVAVARGERLVRRRVETGGHVLQLSLDLPDLREPGEGLAQDRAARLPGRFLREVPDRRLARPAHAPGVGRVEPRQDPAERGLADAVRADQPDALAPGELPRDLAEQHAVAVGLGYPLELDHPHILRTGASGRWSGGSGGRGERSGERLRAFGPPGDVEVAKRRRARSQCSAAAARLPAARAASPRSSQTRPAS